LSSGEEDDMETSKKGRKQGKKGKKAKKKAGNKSKREHKSDDEPQKQRAVLRQELGVLESENHGMIDAALYVQPDRAIAELLSQIEQRLHHINESHIRLHERLDHMDESQNEMHDKIFFLIGKQNDQFSCVENMSPIGSTFAFEEEEKEEGHDNSRNGSKGGNATKEFLKRRCGQRLPSNSYETELKPPAKSPSTPRRSKDQDKTSPKPRKGNRNDQEETKYPYYKQFPL